MDTLRSITDGTAHQVLVNLFRNKRQARRQQSNCGKQYFIQRLVCRLFIPIIFCFPETAAVAADVPIGQVIQKSFEGSHEFIHPVCIKSIRSIFYKNMHLGNDPFVQDGQIIII